MTIATVPREYGYALCGEAWDLVKQWVSVNLGFTTMTPEEKDQWNQRKEWVYNEIRNVRRSL
jgi:hypothetical protein